MAPNPPSIGRIVIYRSKTGAYSLPAMVTATVASLNQDNVAKGRIADLTNSLHVHLAVFTPGFPVLSVDGEFVPQGPPALGGTYQEWNVPIWVPIGADAPRWALLDYTVQEKGTWAWPPRS